MEKIFYNIITAVKWRLFVTVSTYRRSSKASRSGCTNLTTIALTG